jgi:hypothetical protein
MSTVITDEIAGPRDRNHLVTFPNNRTLYAPGHVIQTAWREYHQHQTIAANNDTVTRALTGLDIAFACKRSNSLVLCEWWVFYETHYNVNFRPMVNNAVVTTSGFQSYNSASSARWSGLSSAEYEHSFDNSSTPSYKHMQWVFSPGTTASRTYSIGVLGSGGSNYTVYLNRSTGNYSDSNEAGVSWVMLQEIAQ